MKTMSDYTLFCTPEQTLKALELGAPISPKFHKVKDIYGNYSYEIAENDAILKREEEPKEGFVPDLTEETANEFIDVLTKIIETCKSH